MKLLDLFTGIGGFSLAFKRVFPDGWTENVSDTQRYKCLGNAITVNVAEEIIRKLKNNLVEKV